ncbi:MAG: hypothetical protein P1Q69_03255 [Candidatus Thorarchaeota archaeon]|nr:hypothetical protein [Candidatus Thorarchaeota archaeon]
MLQRRGRPQKPLPMHPNKIIADAILKGLSATLELQRNIKTKKIDHLYKSSRETWMGHREAYRITNERGEADFQYITSAEAQLRDNMWRMLVEIATKYGCSEKLRVKNSDDTVGPLNQRFNAGGAAFRNFFMKMYPMQDPESYGKRTKRIGESRKKFRVAGYPESCYGPKVLLTHVDLAPLDFGDAIRSHLEYLETYCYIYDVPVADTRRYCELYMMQVRPFLDRIYSEHKCGKKGFRKGLDSVLHLLKEDIQKHYSIQQEKPTVTDSIEYPRPQFSLSFFQNMIDQARSRGLQDPSLDELERIANRGFEVDDELKLPCLTEKDVGYIWKKAVRRAKILGSQIHRKISTLFPSPSSIPGIIFSKDVGENQTCRIVSEVSIETPKGKGKIDLILFKRVAIDRGTRVVWCPVFVLEIKTKLGFWLTLQKRRIDSDSRTIHGKPSRVVAEFPLFTRSLTADEWAMIVNATPIESTRKQVKTYADALIEKYNECTGEDVQSIPTGTVLVDASEKLDDIERVLSSLVTKSYESLLDQSSLQQRILFKTEGTNNIALITHPQDGSIRVDEPLPAPWTPSYDPLGMTARGQDSFTLYLSPKTLDSSGESASWIARYHHGLQMLHEMRQDNPDSRTVWVDLANEFNEPLLAEARLRLRPYSYNENDIQKSQPDYIRDFFESIEVIGIKDGILDAILNEQDVHSVLSNQVPLEGKTHLVVSGWDTINDVIPSPHRKKQNRVLQEIIDYLSRTSSVSIVWFDSPVPSDEKSVPYSSRVLLPYYSNSPLSQVVTKIIWNVPVAPERFVSPDSWKLPVASRTPMHDDIRSIIHHTRNSLSVDLVLVSPLHRWSRRFENGGLGVLTKERDVDDVVPNSQTRERIKVLSFSLIPWLVRIFTDAKLVEEQDTTLGKQYASIQEEFDSKEENVVLTNLELKPSQEPTILQRISFKPIGGRLGKSFVSVTEGGINSRKLYRSPNKVRTAFKEHRQLVSVDTERFLSEESHGVIFADDAAPIYWIVLEDPDDPVRILIGCFRRKEFCSGDFIWSEQDLGVDMIDEFGYILDSPSRMLTLVKDEIGYVSWFADTDSDNGEYCSLLELISGGWEYTRRLRAYRELPVEQLIQRERTCVPEQTISKLQSLLKEELEKWKSSTKVSITLEDDDGCCLVKIPTEGTTIQEIRLKNVPDIVSLLRWPLQEAIPLRLDSGQYVRWDVFGDISYGAFKDLRPLVETKTARDLIASLPKSVSELLDVYPIVKVPFVHDRSLCPIMKGENEHKSCWRFELPEDCPEEVKSKLEGNWNSKELYGLIAARTVGPYSIEIVFPKLSEKTESIVYHEDTWIRRLFRENGLRLKSILPGSFTRVENQSWEVTLVWRSSNVEWFAKSKLTGLRWSDLFQILKLDYSLTLSEQRGEILDFITARVSLERISNCQFLIGTIERNLREKGFSETEVVCRIEFVRIDSTKFRYKVVSGKDNVILDVTHVLDGSFTKDEELDMMQISLWEGELSSYNIINREEFLEEFSNFLDLLETS